METNKQFTEEQFGAILEYGNKVKTLNFLKTIEKAVENSNFFFYPKGAVSRVIFSIFFKQYLALEFRWWRNAVTAEEFKEELMEGLSLFIDEFFEEFLEEKSSC